MTKDEIRRIFNSDLDSIPEYEVITVVHNHSSLNYNRNKRSVVEEQRFMTFEAFGKSLELQLELNDNFLYGDETPIFLAYSTSDRFNNLQPKRVEYKRLRFVSKFFCSRTVEK